MQTKLKSLSGFTLIEQLITVMPQVMLGALAAPNFGNAVSNNRLVSHTSTASTGTPSCGGGACSGWQSFY